MRVVKWLLFAIFVIVTQTLIIIRCMGDAKKEMEDLRKAIEMIEGNKTTEFNKQKYTM